MTTFPFRESWCEGVVAQMKGDKAAAHAAFTTARNEVAKLVAKQPSYAEALCVLGMADAALGNKEDAIREGRRAAELLPVGKRFGRRRVCWSKIWLSFMRGRARRILPSNS